LNFRIWCFIFVKVVTFMKKTLFKILSKCPHDPNYNKVPLELENVEVVR
jgi:hypothetical protein